MWHGVTHFCHSTSPLIVTTCALPHQQTASSYSASGIDIRPGLNKIHHQL
eukprot:m.79371 g.79371  ORF g.79371 m.79371 type:complete len:50 (+) comp14514_c0_seq30:733-882(+)